MLSVNSADVGVQENLALKQMQAIKNEALDEQGKCRCFAGNRSSQCSMEMEVCKREALSIMQMEL